MRLRLILSVTPVSYTHLTQLMIQGAINVLRIVNNSLYHILSRMKELAKSLPEYATVRSMGGVGDSLAPRLIAEDVYKRQVNDRIYTELRLLGRQYYRFMQTHVKHVQELTHQMCIRDRSLSLYRCQRPGIPVGDSPF